MRNIDLTLPELHDGQYTIVGGAKRFNVVNCGRRFGKTVLAQELITDSALKNNNRCAYFAPTYKMLNEVWKEVVATLAPVTVKKDTQQKQIILITGSLIDFWSLDSINSARGRKYHRVIVDEAAFVAELQNAWQKVLRPMLTDYRGDAWFLSTPQGEENYFKTLFDNELTHQHWKSWQMPTSTNPYIPGEEIEEARQMLPEDVFAQEYLAEFVRNGDQVFASEFDKERHIKPVTLRDAPVFLAFDFNIANSCTVWQKVNGAPKCAREYRFKANLDQFCYRIKKEVPGVYGITVNGDASGASGSSMNNTGSYELIRSIFGLSYRNIRVPKANPSHKDSRMLTNLVLRNLDVEIDPSCSELIRDLNSVKVLAKGLKTLYEYCG